MNTVDRYHDLLAEGKTTEDAFFGATERIGDVEEILASVGLPVAPQKQEKSDQKKRSPKGKTRKKILRAQGCHIITMLMLCLYFILSFATSAWHITWLIFLIMPALENVYCAIIDIIYAKAPDTPYIADPETKKLQNHLSSAIWLIILIVYFIISFTFAHWHLTWLIFLLGSAAQSLMFILLMLLTRKEK